jgi:Tol biopolymer transport system component
MRPLLRTLFAVVPLAGLVLLPISGQAAFPGPNGKIAFASNEESEGSPEGDLELYTIDPDGTDQTQITANACEDTQPNWSPGPAAGPLGVAGISEPILAYASTQQGDDPPGDEPAACEEDFDIWLTTATGSDFFQATNNPATDWQPGWSPNGRFIVFSSDRDGDFELYRLRFGPFGTRVRQLTDNEANDVEPNWSPDGKSIVYASDQDGDYEIYVINLPTRQEPDPEGTQLTTNSGIQDNHPNWAPDMEQITFHRNQDLLPLPLLMDNEVWKMNSDGSGQTRLTDNLLVDDDHPAWSPDDTMITYQSECGDILLCLLPADYEIFVMNQDGSGEMAITDDSDMDIEPDWGSFPVTEPEPEPEP